MDVKLDAKLILKAHVELAPQDVIGDTGTGTLRVIPIIGGTFEGEGLGEGLRGRIVPGGADWNKIITEDINYVFAKYYLETDDGVFIAVENDGMVDFSRMPYKIVTRPKFEVDANNPKYAWMNTGVYVGELFGDKEMKDLSYVNLVMYRME